MEIKSESDDEVVLIKAFTATISGDMSMTGQEID